MLSGMCVIFILWFIVFNVVGITNCLSNPTLFTGWMHLDYKMGPNGFWGKPSALSIWSKDLTYAEPGRVGSESKCCNYSILRGSDFCSKCSSPPLLWTSIFAWTLSFYYSLGWCFLITTYHSLLVTGQFLNSDLWTFIYDNIIAIIDVLESTKCVLQTASLSPIFTQAWLLCDKQGYHFM